MTYDEYRMHRLNLRKSIQAAAVLLRTEPHERMNYMRLIKILYLADRETLRLFGHTITRDRVVAMERGPVLSEVLDIIKYQHVRAGYWGRFIQTCGYDVQLIRRVGIGALSRAEIDVLRSVAEKYATLDEWDMVQECHKLPEWKKHQPSAGGCNDIPLVDILAAVDRKDDAKMIAREEEVSAEFDKFLMDAIR